MWKAAKPGEPCWETPFGPGRPGWHLECSAMAHKYLGRVFDIHGGGVDLVFPHHENEIAQSRAFGDDFARYWAHNAWVTMSGEKMSKSLGNSVLVSEMVKQWRPLVLRYYLGTPHYRSTIEYSPESLREAESALGRIEGFLQRGVELAGQVAPAAQVPEAFAAAMDDDDFAVPQALAVVHTTVRQGNAALADGDTTAVATAVAEVRAMLGVLGMDPLAAEWSGAASGAGARLDSVVDSLVGLVLEQRQRQAARARKDYATADAIRDELKRAGLAVEDTPSGPRWELAGE